MQKRRIIANKDLSRVTLTLDLQTRKPFFFDSGASVSTMGEIMARENKFTIRRLSKPRNVHEASGAKLDVIGTADMFVKI